MRTSRTILRRAVTAIAPACLMIAAGVATAQQITPAASRGSATVAITPQAALDSLITGNRRFVSGRLLPRTYPDDRRRAVNAHPFAAILGCMDSRTPTDLIFDRGLGETFGIRVAGNLSNGDVLGSLEYAAKVKGVVLIAVIGHSDCGAVEGAISNAQLGNLTGLLVKITPAINAVPANVKPRDTSNRAFVQMVADSNVTWTMRQIRELSPVLRELIDAGKVMLVGGMYDVREGTVRFFTRSVAAESHDAVERH